MLPQASTSEESCVVLLDWFNGHLTKEVADIVKKKGHVLLFHGGGTTPFTQVNDTHLHAILAAKLVEQEVKWSQDERQRLLAAKEYFPNRSTTPSPTRFDVLALVQEAWQMLDHNNVASKGYRQTGPEMPMSGVVRIGDVYENLLGVMNRLDPSKSPTDVGTQLREDAIKHVTDGLPVIVDGIVTRQGKWDTWGDVQLLIQEHEDHAGAMEGMEAFSVAPYDDRHPPDLAPGWGGTPKMTKTMTSTMRKKAATQMARTLKKTKMMTTAV